MTARTMLNKRTARGMWARGGVRVGEVAGPRLTVRGFRQVAFRTAR